MSVSLTVCTLCNSSYWARCFYFDHFIKRFCNIINVLLSNIHVVVVAVVFVVVVVVNVVVVVVVVLDHDPVSIALFG